MMKISKVYPRDIIAFFVLMFALYLIYLGINAIVSGIVIMIVTFYFTWRFNEEKNPNGNVIERIKKVEQEVKEIPKTPKVPLHHSHHSEPPDHVKYDHVLRPTESK